MKIETIDHIVLTVSDMDETINFYSSILGMGVETFGEDRKALTFGTQKINLHQKGAEFLPNAKHANVGTVDICFIATTPLEEIERELRGKGVALESDIVQRTGAQGPIFSLYLRDPDGNLIELSNHAT